MVSLSARRRTLFDDFHGRLNSDLPVFNSIYEKFLLTNFLFTLIGFAQLKGNVSVVGRVPVSKGIKSPGRLSR